MDSEQMKARTKSFALASIGVIEGLPRTMTGQVLGRQLLRSATSVGANYRSACLARSKAEFAAKLGIVAEEADESQYWTELLVQSGTVDEAKMAHLMSEAKQITSIVVAARKTARKRKATAKAAACGDPAQ